MIAIPPFILLIPAALCGAAFAFFALANILSLVKYGARNFIGFLATFVFIAGAALILFTAWEAVAQVAWTTPVPLFEVPTLSF